MVIFGFVWQSHKLIWFYVFKKEWRRHAVMAERITIMLNSEIVKKLRKLQAKKITEASSSVSFSRIVNEVLEKGLK